MSAYMIKITRTITLTWPQRFCVDVVHINYNNYDVKDVRQKGACHGLVTMLLTGSPAKYLLNGSSSSSSFAK